MSEVVSWIITINILFQFDKAEYERLKAGEQIADILEFWIPANLPVPEHIIDIANYLLAK